jgi:hypothetical protein
MKKVLIIGYFWPYCHYGGGSPRLGGLAKYLSEFGWQPIILTPSLREKPEFEVKVIETPNRDIFYRRIIASSKKKSHLSHDKSFMEQIGNSLSVSENRKSLTRRLIMLTVGIVSYPDTSRGWIPFAIKAGSRIIEKENIDAIISVWPITAHLVAKALKQKYNIPWIADFSHLWSQSYYYHYGPVRKLIDRRLEVKTLRYADALTTISQFFVTILKELHKQKSVYPITHGFDPSWINNNSVSITPKFRITYTGHVYQEKYKPSKLFAALKELIDEGVINRNEVEVLFYGVIQGWLKEEIEQYNLSDIVHQCGFVSHSASLQKQRESQILLHLGWDDKNIKGFYTSKIFYYLAAQRPVLAVGGASAEVVRDLLGETKAGVYCLTIEEIKDALYHFYMEYKREGKVSYNGDLEKVNKYSHREMARKYSEILDSLT